MTYNIKTLLFYISTSFIHVSTDTRIFPLYVSFTSIPPEFNLVFSFA